MKNKRLHGPRPAAQPAAFEAPAGRWAPSCPPFHGSRSAPLPLCLRMFGLNIHALPPSLPLVATRRPCACRCGRIWPGFGCRPAGFRPGSQLWGAGAARCLWPPPARRAPFLQLTGRWKPPARAIARPDAPPRPRRGGLISPQTQSQTSSLGRETGHPDCFLTFRAQNQACCTSPCHTEERAPRTRW